jgi:hypothetical protein
MLLPEIVIAYHAPQLLPQDFNTNWLMLLRWVHFIAGIAWVGLLYFFNLVNIPFMRELDPATKGMVVSLGCGGDGARRPDVLDEHRSHRRAQRKRFGRHGVRELLCHMDARLAVSVFVHQDGHAQRSAFGGRQCLDSCGSGLRVPVVEFAWMGEQPLAFDWNWRRLRMVHAAERLGRDMAGTEEIDCLDRRKRDERHAHAGRSCRLGAPGVSRFTN